MKTLLWKWGKYMHSLKKAFARCRMFKGQKPEYKKYRKGKRGADFGQESILKMLFDMRINGALEEFLKQDQDYQKLIIEARRQEKEIENLKLSHEQWVVIDNILSAYNSRVSRYGRLAYNQGFHDALNLIKEMYQIDVKVPI